MTELVTHGAFLSELPPWVLGGGGTTTQKQSPSYKTPGSLQMIEADPASDTCWVRWDATTPVGGARWRLSFALQSATVPEADVVATAWFHVWIAVAGATAYALDEIPVVSVANEWHRFSYDVYLPSAIAIELFFDAQLVDNTFYVDDVSLLSLPPDTGSCEDLAWELAGVRLDRAMVKHPESRYQGVLAQAMREAPKHIWPTDINTSIVTVTDQRRYSLAAITDLDDRDQLRSVWVEDENDGHYYQRGRWDVEDDLGVLTLVFHEDPDAAGLTIKLEYLPTLDALDCADPTDATNLDRDWLIARAMTLLLLEANPQMEDPTWLTAQLNTWDVKRQSREGQLRRQYRTKRKTVTRRWS